MCIEELAKSEGLIKDFGKHLYFILSFKISISIFVEDIPDMLAH